MKKTITIALLLCGYMVQAQNVRILDEVVAVVGENIILKSQMETEYAQAKKEMEFYDGDLKCEILNQLIIQKLYLHKGKVDSTYADAARVDSEVDRRI
ncbi:MAG: peptidylprolyl isomerase, partial [Bacteroidia bacterium]